MMTIGIPIKEKRVLERIHDAMVRFEVETGYPPNRLAVSSNLIAELLNEEFYCSSFKSYYDPTNQFKREIFGRPCYCIAEADIIMVSL